MLSPTYKSRSEDFKKQFKEIPPDERLIVGKNFKKCYYRGIVPKFHEKFHIFKTKWANQTICIHISYIYEVCPEVCGHVNIIDSNCSKRNLPTRNAKMKVSLLAILVLKNFIRIEHLNLYHTILRQPLSRQSSNKIWLVFFRSWNPDFLLTLYKRFNFSLTTEMAWTLFFLSRSLYVPSILKFNTIVSKATYATCETLSHWSHCWYASDQRYCLLFAAKMDSIISTAAATCIKSSVWGAS